MSSKMNRKEDLAKSGMLREIWRPKTIDQLIGQDDAKALVGAMLRTNKIPRTILLHGAYSAGKTTFARIVGRTALCHSPESPGIPCGKCESCKAFDLEDHPDFLEMNAADKRGVSDMRDLASRASILPMNPKSTRRFIHLDEVHMLTRESFQSMLKPLEEPPAHIVYLLSTTDPQKIPETIRSRCSAIRLRAMTPEQCTSLLFKVAKRSGLLEKGLTKKHLLKIAYATNSTPRNALNCLEQVSTMIEDAGDSKLDSALINSFVQASASIPADAVAESLMRFILLGKVSSTLRAFADNQTEAQFLTNKLRVLTRQALRRVVSSKLSDPYYDETFSTDEIKAVLNHKKPRLVLELLNSLLADLVDLQFKCSTYSVPVEDALDSLLVTHCIAFSRLSTKEAAE